ncbi:MAG: hypothetical protein JOZ17_03665, partial [Acetobacteraceae bacterium]|nr:hypothetical protein [Acetobacteraceae bacterium]
GVDHVTITMVERRRDEDLKKLSEDLRTGTYRPQQIRRHDLPKPGAQEQRPLGIPTVRDRVVQTARRMVLEPILEREFAAHSSGVRPGRGGKDALRRVEEWLKAGDTQIVDADLKSDFDTIPHDRRRAQVGQKVSDGRVRNLIARFLKQGVLDGMREWTPERGSPQGAVITPPTMWRTTLLGASFKRGWTDPIHDPNLLLVDLDPLHQRPDDLTSRVPVGLLQPFRDATRELLQSADHPSEFRLLGGLADPLPALDLQLGQPLPRRRDPRLEFRPVEYPVTVGIDQSRNPLLYITDQLVDLLHLPARASFLPLKPSLVLRPNSLGLGQEMTDLFPHRGVEHIGADLLVPAQALAAEAVGVRAGAAIVRVGDLALGRGAARRLTVAAVAAPLADHQALEQITATTGPIATAWPILSERGLDGLEEFLVHQRRDLDEDSIFR